MYSFLNDYSEGAHEKILEKLRAFHLERNIGYGLDQHSMNAMHQIQKRLRRTDLDIHFVMGGTQANLLAMAAFLKPYESVLSATTGHINDNETGAIEATGHKIIGIPHEDGKLRAKDIESVLKGYRSDYRTKPGLVYISNTTELGTVYRKDELLELKDCCDRHQLLLYLDGARLGSALTASVNDVALEDLPDMVDAFTIGGTKNGALMAEAMVIVNPTLQSGFRYMLKRHGAMAAKGFFLGQQFEALFEGDLYFRLAAHANQMALRLARGLEQEGVVFHATTESNQVFVRFPEDMVRELARDFLFEKPGIHSDGTIIVRFVTSWATGEEAVDALIKSVAQYHDK